MNSFEKEQSLSEKGKCRRCGICCEKGGPSFHMCDRQLIVEGRIQLSDIYTIRPGEPAYNNVREQVEPTVADIIKIKSRPVSNACIFYQAGEGVCGIYSDRPLECRLLKCWDTAEIVAVYDRERLSRKDLLQNAQPLWELVEMHQSEISYDRVSQLVQAEDKAALAQLIRYDASLREVTREKTPANSGVLEFLFGYPLEQTISRYGIELKDLSAG